MFRLKNKANRAAAQKEVIKAFGEISFLLVHAMGMQADNIQRQILGHSVGYGEEEFGVVRDKIEKAIKAIN